MAAVLAHLGLLDGERLNRLAARLTVPLSNWNGLHVGDIRVRMPD